MSRFAPGQRLWHPGFGLGTVRSLQTRRFKDWPDGVITDYVHLVFDYDPQREQAIPETQKGLRVASPQRLQEPFVLPRFKPGDRVWHARLGIGYVQAIRHAANASVYEVQFEADAQPRAVAPDCGQWRLASEADVQAWRDEVQALAERLAQTFEFEDEPSQHDLAARFAPFAESPVRTLRETPLPDLAGMALQLGYGSGKPAPYERLQCWPDAALYAWPALNAGLGVVVGRDAAGAPQLHSAFPFHSQGSVHEASLEKVIVWPGQCEAQLEVDIGPLTLRFFDTGFLIHRNWYLQEQRYQFMLLGIALQAEPDVRPAAAQPQPLDARLLQQWGGSEQGRRMLADHQRLCQPDYTWLGPRAGAGADEYEFAGPLRRVRPTQILGEPAWLVSVQVMRERDEQYDRDLLLEVLLTPRSWRAEQAPQVGQDIKGRLWLQGRLWAPLD